MIEILSRLFFVSESLDTAFYRPKDRTDESLSSDLNTLANSGIDFSIQISGTFDEKISLPTSDSHLNFEIELIAFNKSRTLDNIYFFTKEGFLKNLESSEISKSQSILIHEDFSEFSTLTCRFRKWDFDSAKVPEHQKNIETADPRKILKDYTGAQITSNQLFWVTPTEPDTPDDLFLKWLDIATPKAALLLASEISSTEGVQYHTIKGSKTLNIPNEVEFTSFTKDAHSSVHEALYWVFETSRETEVRHTLLSQRLSNNDLKQSERWTKYISRVLRPSLSSAREDYRSHLLVKTGELLKAITDIRKTVSDETSKIIDKTSALTSSLLRDASITFIIAALRQTLIAKNIITKESAYFLLIATAAWLATSILLTGYQNKMFIRSQIRFRRNWSKGLSALISEDELKKISRRPIREAIENYGRIKKVIDLIYSVLIFIILCLLVFG